MEVNFVNETEAPYSKKLFSSVVRKSLKEIKSKKRGEISIILTGQENIKKLNRIYRRKNKSTSILTFVLGENKNYTKQNTKKCLGEIFICYSEAIKKARKNKRSVRKEIINLTIHGLLHLLGHGHKNKKERIIMEALEEDLIKVVR